MSVRMVHGVSSSSSSSDSEVNEDTAAGDSSLRAVGQDEDSSSKSGGGNGSGGVSSPTSRSDKSRALGARPKERPTGERVGEPTLRRGKGVEWNRKDRRSAKVHKGRGQILAADRAAKSSAGNKGSANGNQTTTALKVLGSGPRGVRGPASGGNRPLKRRRFGGDGLIFSVNQLLTVVVLLVVPLVVFVYDLLTLNNSHTAGSGAMTGFYREQLGRLLIGFSVALLISLTMLVGAVSDRNRGRK